ncbi:MAG: DinB family protein [Actinomycetota bacterium]|nr:DinB family protein [Actinomycetota bacterium]
MAMPKPGDRIDPPLDAGERAALQSWLDYHRATLRWKVDGVTEEQLRAAPLPSPLMTLGGLLRHLTDVEGWWFSSVLAGEPDRGRWSDEDPDGEWRVAPTDTVASLLAEYDEECRRSREASAGFALDDIARAPGQAMTLRWVLLHMIEETARHNGHADLLRELADGSTGE